MKEIDSKINIIKNVTSIGTMIGLGIFLISYFVSGVNKEYIISIGLSIVVASITLFIIGLFFNMLEEITTNRNETTKRQSQSRVF